MCYLTDANAKVKRRLKRSAVPSQNFPKLSLSLSSPATYLNPDVKKSFCTISEDLQHDPTAIFCHLEPILETYSNQIKSLHFLSDSPATQYRNRYMFRIMLKKIIPMFKNLENFSWNYSEAGQYPLKSLNNMEKAEILLARLPKLQKESLLVNLFGRRQQEISKDTYSSILKRRIDINFLFHKS